MGAKLILAIAVAVASMANADVCRPRQISKNALEVEREAREFSHLVRRTPYFESLKDEGYRIAREAKDLSSKALEHTPCHYLKREFHQVERLFKDLRHKHRELQRVYPNYLVRDAFHQLAVRFNYLERSMDGHHQPQIVKGEFTCGSSHGKYAECAIPGTVLGATLVQKFSHARCEQGRSWGLHARSLWVDHGCRANFLVSYHP